MDNEFHHDNESYMLYYEDNNLFTKSLLNFYEEDKYDDSNSFGNFSQRTEFVDKKEFKAIKNENPHTINKKENKAPNNKVTTEIKSKDEKTTKFITLKIKRGRKAIKNVKVEHDKYKPDNLIRKIKYLVYNSFRNFINEKLAEINIISYQKFLTVKHNQIANATVEFNKNFLNKKFEEILSENLSNKYKRKDKKYNEKLIESLKKIEKEKNKKYFTSLLELKFIDCLEHFRGKKNIEELEGLVLFDTIKRELSNKDEKYAGYLEDYLSNFEDRINKRTPKKKGK